MIGDRSSRLLPRPLFMLPLLLLLTLLFELLLRLLTPLLLTG
jgi:hypothetical protein